MIVSRKWVVGWVGVGVGAHDGGGGGLGVGGGGVDEVVMGWGSETPTAALYYLQPGALIYESPIRNWETPTALSSL